ncbi:hypothetical protein PAE9249_00730 [Paenibacillus sp. CECT 9249]|nr:hypothetical protein PAE9249_00730 [Paenibacillus sp. CECT 9249]
MLHLVQQKRKRKGETLRLSAAMLQILQHSLRSEVEKWRYVVYYTRSIPVLMFSIKQT